MKISFKKKVFDISISETGIFGKIIGLMFRNSNTNNLLFSFSKDVSVSLHSWFVFFDFYVVWLNKENKIIEFRKIRPFTTMIYCTKKFRKIIEIPVNEKNRNLIHFMSSSLT
ncbi:MAG: hypothetical protein AABX66_03985 [Nanoarchaeota archaeon]